MDAHFGFDAFVLHVPESGLRHELLLLLVGFEQLLLGFDLLVLAIRLVVVHLLEVVLAVLQVSHLLQRPPSVLLLVEPVYVRVDLVLQDLGVVPGLFGVQLVLADLVELLPHGVVPRLLPGEGRAVLDLQVLQVLLLRHLVPDGRLPLERFLLGGIPQDELRLHLLVETLAGGLVERAQLRVGGHEEVLVKHVGRGVVAFSGCTRLDVLPTRVREIGKLPEPCQRRDGVSAL